mmetsp:Transcript_17976/g.44102  ORF Transcript_17976/g.44102 Transcript_17976/m.44102 type:complete len:185 (+) Transcript_17976:66-620(+)
MEVSTCGTMLLLRLTDEQMHSVAEYGSVVHGVTLCHTHIGEYVAFRAAQGALSVFTPSEPEFLEASRAFAPSEGLLRAMIPAIADRAVADYIEDGRDRSVCWLPMLPTPGLLGEVQAAIDESCQLRERPGLEGGCCCGCGRVLGVVVVFPTGDGYTGMPPARLVFLEVPPKVAARDVGARRGIP